MHHWLHMDKDKTWRAMIPREINECVGFKLLQYSNAHTDSL
jgi:hypothetical protein